MRYYGDFLRGSTLYMIWNSYNSLGASVTPTSAGTTFVYKNNSDTQTAVGISADAVGVDSLTGINRVVIDSSQSAAFYAPGNEFHVVKSTASIDGQFVNLVVGAFSIENRYQVGLVQRSLASGGAAQAITLPAVSAVTVDYHKGEIVELVDGPGAGQTRVAISTATTGVFTLDRAWSVQPTSATSFLRYTGTLPSTDTELGGAFWNIADTELTAPPASTASFRDKVNFVFAKSKNKLTQTATTQLLRNDGDSASIGTATVSDDGSTFVRGKFT